MYLCCMGGWHRLICILDNLNHLLPSWLLIRRLCDAHDQFLLGDMAEADMTEQGFDALMGEADDAAGGER